MSVATMPIAFTPLPGSWAGITRWKANGSSDDFSGWEPLVPAPGSGYELCLERVTLGICGAITVTLGENESSGALSKTLFGPFGGGAMIVPLDFRDNPVVLAPNKDFCIEASGAGQWRGLAEAF